MTEVWTIFDTETTNFVGHDLLPIDKQPEIIEFSAIRINLEEDGKFEETEVLDFLCKPKIPITAKITQITGITNEMVADKEPFYMHLGEVRRIFLNSTHRAGHNLVFDERMLDFEYARGANMWRPTHKQRRICTVESSEHLFGRRPSLGDLHERLLGAKHAGAHRALVDVRATAACIVEMRKKGEI